MFYDVDAQLELKHESMVLDNSKFNFASLFAHSLILSYHTAHE